MAGVITDLLLILTIIAHVLLAQAIPLEIVCTQTRAGKMVAKSWVSNAIYIGGGLALTAAHCIKRPGWKFDTLKAGKKGRATVIKNDGKVALIQVTPSGYEGVTAARLPDWTRTKVTSGEYLEHRFYDHDLKHYTTRRVRWVGRSKILEKFRMGMSGSGVYKAGGQLVGIAELQDGTVWTIADIESLMVGRE